MNVITTVIMFGHLCHMLVHAPYIRFYYKLERRLTTAVNDGYNSVKQHSLWHGYVSLMHGSRKLRPSSFYHLCVQGLPTRLLFSHHNTPTSHYLVTLYDESYSRHSSTGLPKLRTWHTDKMGWIPEKSDHPLHGINP